MRSAERREPAFRQRLRARRAARAGQEHADDGDGRGARRRKLLLLAAIIGVIAAAGGAGAQEAPAFADARSGDPDGRTVVLIPGLASSGDVWDGSAEALGDYDLHTLTLAGFAGQAPRDPVEPVIAGAAQAVADMLAEAGARDAALVGHSLGAQVALQAAALAPDNVGQVVVVDSAPFYAGVIQPGATPEQAAAFAGAARAQLAAMPRAAFDAQQAAGMAIYSKDPDYVRTLIEWSEASNQATVAAGFAEVAGGDFRDVLPDVRAQVLVLAAWDAAMGLPRERIETAFTEQYSGAPDARVTVVDDSFHFIMHDRRDAFLAALTAFLEGE